MAANDPTTNAQNALSDSALIQQIAAGDSGALAVLYQRHGAALLRYLMGQIADRAQAEEVLQDVMLAVWHSAIGFRGESSVRTWLLSIAHHRAINARTRGSEPVHDPIHEAETLIADSPPLFESVMQHATHGQIRAALHQLPDSQRETLELVFYHALSGSEAAHVLGVASGTVKSRLHRALATLRRLLKEAEITGDRL
jgi:RNA polymerase sigma-70 factor (ECF subfamily)